MRVKFENIETCPASGNSIKNSDRIYRTLSGFALQHCIIISANQEYLWIKLLLKAG